jgi:3-hydroxyacyl-[acyl-carrier-protein] dehydratase
LGEAAPISQPSLRSDTPNVEVDKGDLANYEMPQDITLGAQMEITRQELKLPMGYQEITKILPHRYPFLLIDKVVELEPEKHILAYKNVSANEEFFNGHFPGLPVMPGVMQIEAMAQAGGILAYFGGDFDPATHVAFLAGVDDARFRKPVVPGDRLDLRVEQVSRKRSVIKIRGLALVNDEVVSEATIIAVVKER